LTDLIHFDYYILLRLVVAVVLGGIIGFERGGNNHDAGLRTHMIVCLGATSVMVVSECLVWQYGIPSEIMRMGAQVISGVGFLGVGSIIVDGNRVRGITTAAGLWTTACIGLVVGSGYYIIAISIVALMMFAMLGLRSLALHLKTKSLIFNVKIELDDNENIKNVLEKLIEEEVQIKSVKLEESNDKVIMILEVRLSKNTTSEGLMYNLCGLGGVKEFTAI